MNQEVDQNSPAPKRYAASDRFSDAEQLLMRQEFSERLKIAFDGATNAEIARKLKTTDATVKCYTDAERLPVYEILVQISRVTGCNLHWLMTGSGEKRVTRAVELFDELEERSIRDLAARSGRTFEEEIRVLTIAAVELVEKV